LYDWTGSELVLDVGEWLLRVVHPWNAILFGLLAVNSYMQLRALGPPPPPWQSDPDWWKKGHRDPWNP
jgi:hypothetical protein